MAENELVVEVREATGKGAARRLRQAGRIPGVCYGRNTAPVSVSLDPKGLEHVLRTSASGFNTLFEVKGGGDFDGKPVLVRELQRDPVSGHLVHADLYMVDLQQRVHVSVPVHLEGSPEGVKMASTNAAKGAGYKQIQFANVGREQGGGDHVFRIRCLRLLQRLLELRQVAVHMIAEFLIVLIVIFDGDEGKIIRTFQQTPGKDTAIAIEIFIPGVVRDIALDGPGDVDGKRIQPQPPPTVSR